MAIYFKCRACKGTHPSPIQMGKTAFEDPTNKVANNSTRCPTTGKTVAFGKTDLFWKDDPQPN